jgi:hypothetical protein
MSMSSPIRVKASSVEAGSAKRAVVAGEAAGPPQRLATTVVQMIVYGPGVPAVIEGTATTTSAGAVELELPIITPPPAGTTVQVILYGPGRPTVIEGTTTAPAADGSFEIIPLG